MDPAGQGAPSLASFLSWWRKRHRQEAQIGREYAGWARLDQPDAAEWAAQAAGMQTRPVISLVMALQNPDPGRLREAINAVKDQYYQAWQLVVVDDASSDQAVVERLSKLVGDPRIEVATLPQRQGLAGASNAGLMHTSGLFVLFISPEDPLPPHAVGAIARVVELHPEIEMVFSDEDLVVDGRRTASFFKPGWNPDMLLSRNVVGHLAAYRRTLLNRVGGLRNDFEGAEDFDLALRAVADTHARKVCHLPQVLHHARPLPATAEVRRRDAAVRALQEHFAGRARILVKPNSAEWPVVRFNLSSPAPRISIVTPKPWEAPGHLYYDPILLEHVATPAEATGEVLIFLASGIAPRSSDWLGELAAQVSRPEIGVAGARLTGPTGRVLHTGYTLHPRRIVQSILPADRDDPGYRDQFRLLRTVSAVSGDCLAIRRTLFESCGGFNRAAGDFTAVDLSLRLAEQGLRTVWSPYAWLQYATPPRHIRRGARWMRKRWAKELAKDPFLNANFILTGGRLRLVPKEA